MSDERGDSGVEELLARYRPSAPDDAFRERVLSFAANAPASRAVRPPIVELAAGLLMAALLQWAAAHSVSRAGLLEARERPAEVDATPAEAEPVAAYAAWSLSPPISVPSEGEF